MNSLKPKLLLDMGTKTERYVKNPNNGNEIPKKCKEVYKIRSDNEN